MVCDSATCVLFSRGTFLNAVMTEDQTGFWERACHSPTSIPAIDSVTEVWRACADEATRRKLQPFCRMLNGVTCTLTETNHLALPFSHACVYTKEHSFIASWQYDIFCNANNFNFNHRLIINSMGVSITATEHIFTATYAWRWSGRKHSRIIIFKTILFKLL